MINSLDKYCSENRYVNFGDTTEAGIMGIKYRNTVCIEVVHIKAIGKSEYCLGAWTGHEGSRRLRLPDFKTVGT